MYIINDNLDIVYKTKQNAYIYHNLNSKFKLTGLYSKSIHKY